jgi:hypothetical protein
MTFGPIWSVAATPRRTMALIILGHLRPGFGGWFRISR